MQNLDTLGARIIELERQLDEAHTAQATLEYEIRLHKNRSADLNARLSMILSVSAALLISRDVDAVVRLIVDEAGRLFPGTTVAQLFLKDQEHEQLVLRADNQSVTIGTTVSYGLALHAFMAPRAMLMVGPELEQAWEQLDPAQRDAITAQRQPWPLLSALLAPLRFEGQRLGALVLYGGVNAHLYHPRDLPFIQALADLAAVAIDELSRRAYTAALQRDLDRSQSLHAEAQARLSTAQAQLLQSAKLAAVGELAASVAHEINNPLYAARNSLYLVEQDVPTDMPARVFLGIAQQELGRIARIITRMRDFYRPSKAELSSTDLNLILQETLELVQTHLRHEHVTVEADLRADLPPCIAHADQLRQVFLNIILNACDAMSGGGVIHVRSEVFRASDDTPPSARITIADTGIGILPEHMEHLFEPFYTTKPQGTGLGLAISAHIITQHGGRISVDSTPGQGSSFRILLPLNP